MLHEFKQIPEPLQKQTLIRLGFTVLFLVLFVVILIGTADIYLWLPCIGATGISIGSAALLFRRAVSGEYVMIDGVCVEAAMTAVRRRIKHIVLQTDVCKIKVPLRSRVRIQNGAAVRLYVSSSTPIYERDGIQVLSNYLAIERK